MKVSQASSITLPATEVAEQGFDFKLLFQQASALTRLSLRRIMNTKVFWMTMCLAMLPVFVMSLFVVVYLVTTGWGNNPGWQPSNMLNVLEPLFLGAYLHLGLFLSAAAFGTQALRDEMENQTLHYFFLQPAPRWLLIPCKFAAYLMFAVPVFCLSLFLVHVLIAIPFGLSLAGEFFFTRSYAFNFLSQLAVIVIALIVFGAVTVAVSTFFRNIFYVILVYGWEFFTAFVPESIKHISLTYHLKALLPFDAYRTGPIGIPAEGPGALQVVLVLSLTTIITLALACWWSGRKECLYTNG